MFCIVERQLRVIDPLNTEMWSGERRDNKNIIVKNVNDNLTICCNISIILCFAAWPLWWALQKLIILIFSTVVSFQILIPFTFKPTSNFHRCKASSYFARTWICFVYITLTYPSHLFTHVIFFSCVLKKRLIVPKILKLQLRTKHQTNMLTLFSF